MADLLKHQVYAQLRKNTDTTLITGAADWHAAAVLPFLDVSPDGFGLIGDKAQEDVPTEHKDKGIRYRIPTKRNEGVKNLVAPLHPENAALLLELAIAETAAGLPLAHQGRHWFTPGVINGVGLGRELSGVLGKTLALSFDLSAPAAVIANLGVHLNRDSQITGGQRFTVTGATNATPIVVTIGTHTIKPAETIVIAGVGGNTAANGTWTISEVTGTTITLYGSVGNGAYTSGGTATWGVFLDVTGATNATPIVVTTAAHGFVAGDVVTIAGVGGNTAANGTWNLTSVTTTTMTLQGSAGNGAYTSGGTVVRTAPPGTSSGAGYSTIAWPTMIPYVGNRVYIDFNVADSNGTFVTGWSGKNTDAKSISFNYDNGAILDIFAPNSNADLDQAWTKLHSGDATLTLNLVLIFAQSAYANYHRIAGIRKARVRIMGVGSAPSGSTTTVNTEAAGSTVTVEVVATTGFAVNQYVILDDGTKQCVGKVTTVNAGVSLVIDTLDVAIGAGATVRNTAWELKVPSADMVAAPVIGDQGAVKGATIDLAAALLAGNTSIVTVKAYDHS